MPEGIPVSMADIIINSYIVKAMRNTTPLRLGLLSGGAMAFAMSMGAQTRPNIILFLVDDMGWQETSLPFWTEKTPLNERYRTPNMEKLAEAGVKFTDAYACAISSPSRASLMSGMNAARHRVTNWTLEYNTKTDAGSSVIELPDWNYNGIQPATTTNPRDTVNSALVTSLPQVLHDNGYYTIHCGKAHYGSRSTTGADPLTMGYDVNIAGSEAGGPGSYLPPYGNSNYPVPGLDDYAKDNVFLTEALTQEAIKKLTSFLDNNESNQPFYLYMSHYAIHVPYTEDTRFSGNYKNKVDPMLGVQLNTSEINHAALVEGMDKSLGDIREFLESRPGLAENTIIIFMSDNGGQAVSVRQGTQNRDQNYPLRGGKGSSYMGGVREPMIVYWPGVTDQYAGTSNDSRVMIEDFYPTILEMAGVTDYETVQHVDGRSIVDIIKNNTQGRDRVNIWHFPNLWGESQSRDEGYGAYSAIMKGDYHLLYFWETQERRLYNIKEDISEENNLIDELPDVARELSIELADSLRSYGAQRPSFKATGEVAPWPDDPLLVAEPGTVLTPDDRIFQYSDDMQKHYYRIVDNQFSAGGIHRNAYWTQGEHYGYKAIQASTTLNRTERDGLSLQLFYFEKGSDENHFRIKTLDGQNVDYVDGTTSATWNDGKPDEATETVVDKYLQYGTPTAGEFVIRKSAEDNYYLIGQGDELMNNRGSDYGVDASMKWVVNDYGGSVEEVAANKGSQYKFELYDPNASVGEGEVAEPFEGIFRYSNDSVRYYYNIRDSRPEEFFWTQGEHYDNPTIQISSEELTGDDAEKQLFYFMEGRNSRFFTIYTYDGQPLIFTSGTTVSSWDEAQKPEADRTTVTQRYVQFGDGTPSQFQLVKTSNNSTYGLQVLNTLLNNRGSANGEAANMLWVVNGYSGNSVSDAGSRYRFIPRSSKIVTGIKGVELPVDRPMTRAELAKMGDKVQVYDLRGIRVRDIRNADRGLYIIRTATDAYKVALN